MERLTIDFDNERHWPHGAEGVSEDRLTGNYCRGEFEATAIVERLYEIENILFDENGKERISFERLKELVQADADGRLVVLPCKVGDTVFIIVTKRKNYYKKELFSYVRQSRLTWHNMQRVLNCYGDTVFLTREEAEAALEKMGGGEE